MSFIVESRRNSLPESEWEQLGDQTFTENSRDRKAREIERTNVELGWQKYRIKDVAREVPLRRLWRGRTQPSALRQDVGAK